MQRTYKYAPLARVELTDEEVQLLVAFWTKNKNATQSSEVDELIAGGQIYTSALEVLQKENDFSQKRSLRDQFKDFLKRKEKTDTTDTTDRQRLHSESSLWELLVNEAKKAGIDDLSQIIKTNKKAIEGTNKALVNILECINKNVEYTPTERAQLKDFLNVLFHPYARIDGRVQDYPKSILEVINISNDDFELLLQAPGKLSDEQIEAIMRRNPLDFYELVAPIIGMKRVHKIEGRDVCGQYPAFDFLMSDSTSEIKELIEYLRKCKEELSKSPVKKTEEDIPLNLEGIESIDKALRALENDRSINFSDLFKKNSTKPDTDKLLKLAKHYITYPKEQRELGSVIFNTNTLDANQRRYIAKTLRLLVQITGSKMPSKEALEGSFYPFLSESDLELIKRVNPWFYYNYLVDKSIPKDEIIKEPTMFDLARYESLMRLFPVMDKRKASRDFVKKGSINLLAHDYLEIALNRSKLSFSIQNRTAILDSVERGITYNAASSPDASAVIGKKNTSDTINYLKGLKQDVTGLADTSDIMIIIDACLRNSQTPDFKGIPYQSKISGIEKDEAAREIFNLIESPFMRCVYTMYLGYNKEHMKFSIEEIAHFWQVPVSTIVKQMNDVAARIPDSNIKDLFSPVCLGIAVPEGTDLHNPKDILKYRFFKLIALTNTPDIVIESIVNRHNTTETAIDTTWPLKVILDLAYRRNENVLSEYLSDKQCIILANEMLEELYKQRNNHPVNPTKGNLRLVPLPGKQN